MSLTEDEKRKIVEGEKLRQSMQGKSTGVAVFLSFIVPGLGDLYCGSYIKAFIHFALVAVSIVLMLIGIGFLLYFFVWIAGLITAWMSASKSQRKAVTRTEGTIST